LQQYFDLKDKEALVLVAVALSVLLAVTHPGIRQWAFAWLSPVVEFGAPTIPANHLNVILLIRRTQRFTLIMRRPRFILHFKADVSSDEIALIKKYKLWRSHLYSSEEFKRRLEQASAPADDGWKAVKALLGLAHVRWPCGDDRDMSHETDLRLAIAYLTDLEAELEARGNDNDPRVRSAAREDMRHQLDHTRVLVAKLEHQAPDTTCQHDYDGREVTIDLEEARIWCHVVEAKLIGICYDDSASAATWMEKAVAINPGRARNHALLALFLSDAGDHPRATEAADRAVLLESDDINYRKIRDMVGRYDRAAPSSKPDYPWWHVGKYTR
jgi:hypothetical protein